MGLGWAGLGVGPGLGDESLVGLGSLGLDAAAVVVGVVLLLEGGGSQRDLRWEAEVAVEEEDGLWDEPLGWVPPAMLRSS